MHQSAVPGVVGWIPNSNRDCLVCFVSFVVVVILLFWSKNSICHAMLPLNLVKITF